MNSTKLGIIGNMYGDRKLNNPAANAISIPIVVILLLLLCWDRDMNWLMR